MTLFIVDLSSKQPTHTIADAQPMNPARDCLSPGESQRIDGEPRTAEMLQWILSTQTCLDELVKSPAHGINRELRNARGPRLAHCLPTGRIVDQSTDGLDKTVDIAHIDENASSTGNPDNGCTWPHLQIKLTRGRNSHEV
jgi:hypothetical protein